MRFIGLRTSFIKDIIIFISLGFILYAYINTTFTLENSIKSLSVKQEMDIQESRSREEKLAQYIKAIEYQVDIISTKGIK